MPQGPISTYVTNAGGTLSSLNTTAAKVVKATPGRLCKVVVTTPGSAGNLTFNDNNATGGTNVAANQILSLAFGSLTAGQVISLDFPCSTGIVLSSIPTGGNVAISYQ